MSTKKKENVTIEINGKRASKARLKLLIDPEDRGYQITKATIKEMKCIYTYNNLSGSNIGGNIKFFGKVETMELRNDNGWAIWNNGRQLTNVTFTKN